MAASIALGCGGKAPCLRVTTLARQTASQVRDPFAFLSLAIPLGGSGLSATLRDFGRLGLFLLGGGKAGDERILPEGWIKEATSAKMVGGKSVDYGYMLWPIPNASGTINEGAFEARGIFGQHVYMNPREKVVIVVWGVSVFPEEICPAPRSWAEKAYPKLIYYQRHPEGAHFAAWEQPGAIVNDLREDFRSLR